MNRMPSCRYLTGVCSLLAVSLFLFAAAAQQGNPVTNGSFEQLDADGVPVDWQLFGDQIEVTEQAHTGEYAVRLKRAADAPGNESGVNRGWEQDSGQHGAMLSQLRGGFSFWYRAISGPGHLVFFAIPMKDDPTELGGERAWYRIPQSHIGDGQWHEARFAYDFTALEGVKWVQVSPRVRGDAGEWILDDVKWLANVGPVLHVGDMNQPSFFKMYEVEGSHGKQATLRCKIENAGDGDATDISVTIDVPEHLRAEGPRPAEVPDLRPGGRAIVRWTITGRRRPGDRLSVTASAGDAVGDNAIVLDAAPRDATLWAEPFIIPAAGGESTLRVTVNNDGTAFADDIRAELDLPETVEMLDDTAGKPLPLIPPGASRSVQWRVRSIGSTTGERKQAPAKASVSGPGIEAECETTLVVAPERGLPMVPAHLEPGVHRFAGGWVLDTGRVRLVIAPSGVAALRTRDEAGNWRTAAALPQLTRVVLSDEQGGSVEARSLLEGVELGAQGRSLTTDWMCRAEGQPVCRAKLYFESVDDPELIRFRYTLSPMADDLAVLCFEGPMVYAGEGTTGIEKSEAIFPGLEWLLDDEVSSSSLDIDRDHPDRLRYVPHPNEITIPCMSVVNKNIAVGLLWDAKQDWLEENDRPSAVFAVPDRFEGRAANLMGLFVPSVPDFVGENSRRAEMPCTVGADERIELTGCLYASAEAADALEVVDKWFDVYGVPEPEPIPRGSYQDEVEFSMQAYLDTLWIPEEKQWWLTLGHPKFKAKGLGRHGSFCDDLVMGGRITDDATLAERCRDIARAARNAHGMHREHDDLGFSRTDPVHAARELARNAWRLTQTQGDDGEWRFDADKLGGGVFRGRDYRLLGPNGAVEVGTCAREAYEILRCARITGDADAFAEGAKTLEFMKRFRVPRAAQVWECPVHSPDILAAAHAVWAYVEAYRFNRNDEFLREARRWARRGLPFVYTWRSGDFAWMRYGSIPIFGATWFRGSWFGRPVQWNGLDYAGALFMLDEYDDSFPWARVAEGIVRSAQYQQSTEREDIAMWPDNIDAITGKRSGWIFPPRRILRHVYRLLGRPQQPQTAILRDGTRRLHITSVAEIEGAAWRGGDVSFTLTYPPGEHGFTLIAGAEDCSGVRIDGELAHRARRLDGESPTSAWCPHTEPGLISVWIPDDGEHTVALERIEPVQVRMLGGTREVAFDFEASAEGWRRARDIEDFRIEDGLLKMKVTGRDPYMVREQMQVGADQYREIAVRMRVTGGNEAKFYWTTSDSPVFAEDKHIAFPIDSDGEFHEYRVATGEHEMWAGRTIAAIRLDPINVAEAGAEAAIDYIRGVP